MLSRRAFSQLILIFSPQNVNVPLPGPCVSCRLKYYWRVIGSRHCEKENWKEGCWESQIRDSVSINQLFNVSHVQESEEQVM